MQKPPPVPFRTVSLMSIRTICVSDEGRWQRIGIGNHDVGRDLVCSAATM